MAELDSALNKWIDTVPEYRTPVISSSQSSSADIILGLKVKWDPNREDDVFMNQSCTLYANYYWLQICIHRPFIQPSKANRLPFPSLTICTNAARSATHVMETQFKKNGKPLILNRVRHTLLSLLFFGTLLTSVRIAAVVYLGPHTPLQHVGWKTNGSVQRSSYG